MLCHQDITVKQGGINYPTSTHKTGARSSPLSNHEIKHLFLDPADSQLPFGAKVSPLSPFFSERAKQCALEMARAKALEEALSTAQGNQARSRSGSQSSQNSETSSSAPSTESLSSNQSVATEIGSLNEIGLPSIVPKISYSEWSKFGISLFSPTLTNPNSQLYYQYSRKNNRARSCSTGSPRQATDPNPKYASYCGSYSDRLTAPSLNFEHALPGGPPIRRSTSRV